MFQPGIDPTPSGSVGSHRYHNTVIPVVILTNVVYSFVESLVSVTKLGLSGLGVRVLSKVLRPNCLFNCCNEKKKKYTKPH